MIKKSVLLIIPSKNFNEEEFLIIKTAIEKAEVNVFIASDSNFLCIGSNGLKIKSDVQFYNIHESNFAGLILIGGSGMREYWNNKVIQSVSKRFALSKKPVGAICSAPVILARAGLLSDGATCYPDDKVELEREGVNYEDIAVVAKKNIITAKNPASSNEFVKAFLYELGKR